MVGRPPVLPLEPWRCIGSHLSNADIKSLRLACKQFNNAVSLRFDRVFLSANPLNIEVLRNIASHDQFRHQVKELIWDEARLYRGPPRMDDDMEGLEYLSDEDGSKETGLSLEYRVKELIRLHGSEEGDGCPLWFKRACGENLSFLKTRDPDSPDYIARGEQALAQPSLREHWQHYQQLLRQQKDVFEDLGDVEAFEFGVKQFPALKRVTITPAAHGKFTNPLYPTPMIRAFPKGFNYPIPCGWLYRRRYDEPAYAYGWKEYPELRDRYRGFSTAMKVLASKPNSVSELVMTSNFMPTGINCRVFDEPCDEYNEFAAVLEKPGFRRLDITLLVGGLFMDDIEACWRSLSNGRLGQALGEAKDMEEFRLHTTLHDDLLYDAPLIPLQSIAPVEQWSKLRHFELCNFAITDEDLVSFLKALPKTIRSIELSLLRFLDDGNWFSTLGQIRRAVSKPLWADRDAASRPKLKIGILPVIAELVYGAGRIEWYEKEVENFIYGEGRNPFYLSFMEYEGGFVPEFGDPYLKLGMGL
ncbi:hypothetical protein N7535_000707 [Penicillium sp. DV-2018c]|nr:hypothetical protein N7535_000707 [Penicillium sp. DV-2018c]